MHRIREQTLDVCYNKNELISRELFPSWEMHSSNIILPQFQYCPVDNSTSVQASIV